MSDQPQNTPLSQCELLRQLSFLKSLLHNLPDLVWMKDKSGVYMACNQVFESFFGASEAEILGKTDYDFVDPALADSFRENDKKAMAKGAPSVNEEWITFATDGRRVLLETTKTPILGEQGEVIGVLGIGHDITHRKEQEEAIRVSEERLKQSQALSKIGGWELDLETNQLYWSEEVYRIFDLDPERFSPSYESFLQAIHPEDIQNVSDAFEASLVNKAPYSISHRLLVHGQVKYVEEQGQTEYSDEGQPLRTRGTVQDVTQRVLYELQLNRMKSLADQAVDGLYVIAAESGKIVDVNRAAHDCLDYRKEEMLRFYVWDVSTGVSDADEWQAGCSRLIERQGLPFEELHRHRDGHLIPVEVTASYIEAPDGRYFIATVRDISERKKTEQTILESSQRYQAVLASSKDGFWIVSKDSGALIEVNDTYCQMSGFSREELLGKKVWELDVKHSEADARANEEQLLRQGGLLFESEHQRADGSIWPVEVSISYSPIQGGQLFAFLRDISERKQVERRIQHMAYHDVLTGLPNRELLADRLHQLILQSQRNNNLLAICYLDLDGFKPINDRYGHQMGDQLLIRFARRLHDELRESDTLARLGGDEFVLLLADLETIYHAEEIIQRVLESIALPFDIEGCRMHISASIGVTLYPHDQSDPDTLLRHADQAMYKAKESGKNTYTLFDPVADHKMHAYRQAISEFSQALAESQLLLHYQPRIDLQTGDVASVEALVRWQHPQRGLLPPREFLPMIEGSAIEVTLDEWVLRSALNQHMRWRKQGLLMPVSVNISPRHFKQAALPDYLQSLLTGFPPDITDYLELEVIETSALGNTSQVAEIMESCTRMGVKFSLDDFGTGYSSLTYFHRLPISILKIDRSFVRNMLNNPQDQDIVEGVVKLAEALKRPVVAEGVESIELGMMLLQLGCQQAQGFGIAKPMPAEAVPGWCQQFGGQNPWHHLQQSDGCIAGAYDLNVAIFSHRVWLDAVMGFVESGSGEPPHCQQNDSCQFARWYQGIGLFRYGDHPGFDQLKEQHLAICTLAQELIRLVQHQRQPKAQSRLPQLQQLSQELVGMISKLAESEPSAARS